MGAGYNPSWEGRPHRALGYRTPQQFLEHYKQHGRKEAMCH